MRSSRPGGQEDTRSVNTVHSQVFIKTWGIQLWTKQKRICSPRTLEEGRKWWAMSGWQEGAELPRLRVWNGRTSPASGSVTWKRPFAINRPRYAQEMQVLRIRTFVSSRGELDVSPAQHRPPRTRGRAGRSHAGSRDSRRLTAQVASASEGVGRAHSWPKRSQWTKEVYEAPDGRESGV